jgi:ppGpp synthetase/RelA/SpoT-type nucleotidyltranferase
MNATLERGRFMNYGSLMATQRAASEKELLRWRDEYAHDSSLCQAFVTRLQDLLPGLLEGAHIRAQIEGRAKTLDSFTDKIKRKGYRDPLQEMTDLVGLRIITQTLSDVDRVGELIEHEFDVDHGRSVSKPEVLDPDRFGYVSTHYVVQLGPPRSGLAEWDAYVGRPFEIQIRTVLQHAWAIIDHRLNYKSRTEVPRELQRRLFRLSALLEVADDQLDEVEQQRQVLTREYGEQVGRGNLGALAIDAASLDAYLSGYGVYKSWRPKLAGVGYYVDVTISPLLVTDRRDLLAVLNSSGVRTIEQFHTILADAERWATQLLRVILKATTVEYGELQTTIDNALTWFVLYGTLANDATVDAVGWIDSISMALKELIAIAKRPGRHPAGSPPKPHPPRGLASS